MSQRPPSDYPPALTEAQLALKEQLAEYNAAALELSRRINEHSLPCRLPPELLSKIFLITATLVHEQDLDWAYDLERSTRVHSYYKWIYVAHVCRYWREVALDCASLWTFLAFEGYTIVENVHTEILERSRNLPLTVVYHQDGGQCHCPRCSTWYVDGIGLDIIAELLPKIQHLYVIVETDFATESLWDTLREPMESLTTLRVGLCGDAFKHYTSFGDQLPFDLPTGVFASRTPRLQSLVIANVRCSWSNSLFCPSLRHLEINSLPIWQPVASDMLMLLSMLAAMPQLETLIMKFLPEAAVPIDTIASLPRLQYIHLSAWAADIAFMLLHLRCPASTTISLILSYDDANTTSVDVPILVQALSTTLEATPLHTVSYAPPRDNLRSKVSYLRGWAGQVRDLDLLWDARSDVSPRLVVEAAGHETLPAVLRQLAFPQLHALYVRGPVPSTTPWGAWFERAPNVEIVRVTGRAGFLLGTCLGVQTANSAPGDGGGAGGCEGRAETSGVVMPHLRVLQLVNVNFPPPRSPYNYRPRRGTSWCDAFEIIAGRCGKRGIDVKNLVEGLRHRRALGAGEIERVEFTGCPHMKLSHMRPLLRAVPTLVFDGIVISQYY